MRMHALKTVVLAAMLSSGVCVSADDAADSAQLDGLVRDAEKPGFVVRSTSDSLKVQRTVSLPRDVSSIFSFTVEDGAADAELLLAGGIAETGGECGFVKNGPGTMEVRGDVSISGFITVYDGVLDLSHAVLGQAVRANVLGDAQLIPPEFGPAFSEIYVNGEKLVPGRWGPPGSANAGTADRESPRLGGVITLPHTGPSRRDIWKGLKYGIFSHYVWNGYGMMGGMKADGTLAKTIDDMAESFDVGNYVDQLLAAEAQYVVFTAWHSGVCPMFPSSAMATWAPGRPSCPKRDLLGELLDACRAKGLRTFFYCHPYQPVAKPHNDWINDLYAELVDRYGSRLDGLWIDENFQDCTQDKFVDYPRLLKTIKERNPDLVLTHNNGGFQTYGVDEGVQEVQWECHEGRMVSTYQIFTQTAKSPEDMLITTVIQAAANTLGGGIQWSIDAHGAGENSRGGLDEACRPVLDGFVKLFRPIAASIKNTQPSSSYPPPFSGAVVKLSGLSWGVATKSIDDTQEFLHILKPPAGNTLTLPPPADGKLFANARLLADGRAVSLSQTDRGLTLTLPEGIPWQKPDTVIALDVLAPGGVGLVNDTSRAVRYRGGSWIYQRGAAGRQFRNDSHRATADGDSFTFTFQGTDVAWISSRGPDRGVVELSIDGVPRGTVDLSTGSGAFQTVFTQSGLPRGIHTLTGTKRGGAVMHVDAFTVSELINDTEADVSFRSTTWYDSRAAALTGPWEGRGDRIINGSGFSFTFHGTGVELFAAAAFGHADMVLTLDGQPHSTVRVSADQPDRSVATIEGLDLGSHTIEASYTNRAPGGFQSALYGFMVTRPDFWAYHAHRGLGEIMDDAHVSERQGSTGSFTFQGSGVEIITTRDADSRTAHYTLDGGGSSLWVGLNHYAPVAIAGCNVFCVPNVQPGTYTVSFKNAANSSGINFSFVRLTIDALRVFKGESSSATPLFWGKDGGGGTGTWDVGTTAHWHDGLSATTWLDFGGRDHAAVFAGKPGIVTTTAGLNANHITFDSNGYTLRGEAITLTGVEPTLSVAESATAIVECVLAGSVGMTKTGSGNLTLTAMNAYTGDTSVHAGTLTVDAAATLGAGNLTVADGAVCKLENVNGGIADSARVVLDGSGSVSIAAGVVEKVAGLTVNGTTQSAGRYTAATHPAFITGAGVLAVEGP